MLFSSWLSHCVFVVLLHCSKIYEGLNFDLAQACESFLTKNRIKVLALCHAILFVFVVGHVATGWHLVCENILTTYSLECVLPAIACYKVGCEIMPLLQQHCSETVQDNDSQQDSSTPNVAGDEPGLE